MWRYVLLSMLGLCLTLAPALADETLPKAKCLPPEHFQNLGRLPDFLPHASAYLAQNVNDPQGPRIAMDMFMVATALQETEALGEARRYLLLQYTDSFPADYVIRATKKEDLRTFLTSTFTSSKIELSPDFLRQFFSAVQKCLSIHGPDLANDDLWAQAALCAPDPLEAINCHRQIKDHDSNAAKLLAVVRIERPSNHEQFVQLQELKDFATARAWQTHLYAFALTKAEKADPEVQAVLAENWLEEGSFENALPVLVRLTQTSDDPKLLYYRAWAETATNSVSAACSTFRQLADEHPSSAWGKSAAKLAAVLTTHSSNIKQHMSCLDEVYSELRDHPPEKIELDVQWGETPEQQYEASLGIDFVNHAIELLVSKEGRSLVGYSNGPHGSSCFVAGEEQIQRYQKTSAFPSLDLTLTTGADGRYNFNCGFLFTTDTKGSQNTIKRLLESPLFAKPESRRKFIQSHFTRGAIPEPVVSKNGQRYCRWLIPQTGSAELQRLEIILANNGHLVSITFPGVGRIHNLRYGAYDDQPLQAPTWPNLPIAEAKEMGAKELFRLLGAASELFYPAKDPTPKTATNPPPIRR